MSQQIQVKLEELNALQPTKIVESPNVQAKFLQMYSDIQMVNRNTAVQIYQKEVFNFQKLLRENPDLASCTKMSLYGCFLDIAVNGLSLDPTGKAQCYLIPRNVKTGHKDQNNKDIYEKRASVSVTGYGELVMRMRAGQIKYADNPVVVYEGDVFSVGLDNGIKRITYSAAIPRKTTNVIGCFIRLVRNDGSEDFQWLLEGDITRLSTFSAKSNSYYKNGQKVEGKANALYTSNGGQIDPGFLENKTIKHAFDSYPKVRTGRFTQLQTEEDPNEIDYGIEDAETEDIPQVPSSFDEPSTEPEPAPAVIVETTQEDDDAGF